MHTYNNNKNNIRKCLNEIDVNKCIDFMFINKFVQIMEHVVFPYEIDPLPCILLSVRHVSNFQCMVHCSGIQVLPLKNVW